jgi:protein-S-isoprenylcysteine O-methyltransferase Ste14
VSGTAIRRIRRHGVHTWTAATLHGFIALRIISEFLESSNSLFFSPDVRTNPPLIPPPILALLLLLVSGVLMAILPLAPLSIPAGRPVGIFFLVIGFIAGFSGFSAFRKAGTSVRPGDEPTELVLSGPFRVTRNPMYLGLELVLIGALFLTKSLFFLIPPIGFFLLINFVQIPFEEKLMTEHFGEMYREYRRRVRRWL